MSINFLMAQPIEEKGEKSVVFIENKGQWHENVLYKLELVSASLFFEKDIITYHMVDPVQREHLYGRAGHDHGDQNDQNEKLEHFIFQSRWVGANKNAIKSPKNPRSDYRNYILGNDPDKWAGRVLLYKELEYQDIYPNIDLEYYGLGDNMKYDWLLQPGGDPNDIITEFSSNVKIFLQKGDLIIDAPTGKIIEKAPKAYQTINGVQKEIPCSFTLDGQKVGYKLGKYDNSEPLIIDPVVVFSSYSGSSADNWGFSATYDEDGHLYGAGIVFDIGYPIVGNVIQSTFNSLPPFNLNSTTDIGISKFNPQGNGLIYSTYLGGKAIDQPHSMIVNSNNELVVMGTTSSNNFPVRTNGYQTTFEGGDNTGVNGYQFDGSDIFILKLNQTGSFVTGGTYLGGDKNDGLNKQLVLNYGDISRGEVELDSVDNIYVVSTTLSSDFPTTTSASQTSKGFGQDAVVAKFSPNLSSLLWSTYFGGNDEDAGYSLKVNVNGDVYICGGTKSTDLANTSGTINTSSKGNVDGYIAHFNGSNGALINTTYLGTSANDQAFILDHDKNGNIYVFGQTKGAYPVTSGVYNNPQGGQFIHRLKPTLATTVFSTVFGSGNYTTNIVPTAFNVDDCLNILLSGWGGMTNQNHQGGSTYNLPITNDAYQSGTDGSDFYFMVLSNNAVGLKYSTYFGGQSNEHVDGGTSRFSHDGSIYQAVCAGCGNLSFPTTNGAWATNNPGPNCNLGVIKVNFETSITADLTVDWTNGVDTSCNTLTVQFINKSKNANQYEWDFGNGTTSSDVNPIGVFNTFGTYTVTLIATDTVCDISDTATITFDHDTGVLPLAKFSVDYVSCDLDFRVRIQNLSARGANDFYWDFGDGTFSTLANPIHSYSNQGTYLIKLVATDTSCNTFDTDSVEVTFDYDIPLPEVIMSAAECGNGSIDVEYKNDSSWYAYRWKFSDGTIETNKYPTHQFDISGNYSVSLTILDTLCNNLFEYNYSGYFLVSENRLYIPNAFTPNGDENNEFFVISGNSCLQNSKFIILNSFGGVVFESEDPFNEFWDGKINGQPAQEDVYVYRFTSDLIVKMGYIVLIY